MSPHTRNFGKEPLPKKGDRSWALKSFFLSSILWIASLSVAAVYLDKPMDNPSRLALIIYGTILLCLAALAVAGGGYAIASLVTGRRGRKIAWVGLLMSVLPFLCCLGLLVKLALDCLSS